jgi:single-stranded DNA-binding protein
MPASFLARRAPCAVRAVRAFSTTPTRSVARISVIGHLADTPELQATSSGGEIVKYAVASNSGPKENRQTSWFRVAAFVPEGPRRDFLTSLQKGSMVFVEGDATMNTYEDAEGKVRSALNIVQRGSPPPCQSTPCAMSPLTSNSSSN